LYVVSGFSAFESAVITLQFPPGARATGLGEAFTGLADDANATFFNPAGLGLSPMANAWHSHMGSSPDMPFTAVASPQKSSFSVGSDVWAGSAGGIVKYHNGKWMDYDVYLIKEGDESLREIVERYLLVEDGERIERAMTRIRETNDIEPQRLSSLTTLFVQYVPQGDSAEILANRVLNLMPMYRDSSGIATVLSGAIDSTKVPQLIDSIEVVLARDDKEVTDMIELEIPYSVVTTDSITAMRVDETGDVWVGTSSALWCRRGSSWDMYTVKDGLPSEKVTAIARGSMDRVAVGTDYGFAVYENGSWESYTFDNVDITSKRVNAVCFGEDGDVFVGTDEGLIRKNDAQWEVLDTADGLLSRRVTALMFDSRGQLWAGGNNGVNILKGGGIRRYKFPDCVVYTVVEYAPGHVWIGTNKGAVEYRVAQEGGDGGKDAYIQPKWQSFHSKNVLSGNHAYDIVVSGKDVWIATDKAVNQYDYADRQVFLFYEPLLPALQLKGMWHSYFTVTYPTEDWGTFGFHVNYISFGPVEISNPDGYIKGEVRPWEGIFGLSYGLPLRENFSLGLNVQYVNSALAPGWGKEGEGVGQTFAIDAGVLKRNLFTRGFDVGFALLNMGPSIFYKERDEADPIPFTPRLGFAYRLRTGSPFDVNFLCDFHRTIATNYIDERPDPFYEAVYTDLFGKESGDSTWVQEFEEIIVNLGVEGWYMDIMALRSGFLFDYIGQRYELTMGLGIKYENLNFDFSYIYSPEGFFSEVMKLAGADESHQHGSYGVRDQQNRWSLIFRF
jgi:hypothetical protein